ncbi:hypothetical protein EIN_023480 [Entamoeba invadens IP1]|uniref:hypothetical protein n=1 Tax=Entamoeba invadens IP1 TaxID=370355 RepID=UPI0002C3ED75|nr:hypothetical protein EIN_023480 [Entamoeba invadens IP1]ELP90659.1 hypothetical protein EIN_023480 [Entamoeba invadens IP1]|eukprot:XP_004257430.1 hypothetical protein EIN_023480 [Entamoeba invadens IP1]
MSVSNTTHTLKQIKRIYHKIVRNKSFRYFFGEFIGCFILFFCANASPFFARTQLEAGLVIFFVLVPLVRMFIPVSSAQFNPYITIPLLLEGRITVINSIISIFGQLTGGSLGVIVLNISFTDSAVAYLDKSYDIKAEMSEIYGQLALTMALIVGLKRNWDMPLTFGFVIAAGVYVLKGGMIVNPCLLVVRLFVNNSNSMDYISALYFFLFETVGLVIGYIIGRFIIIAGEPSDDELSRESQDDEKDPLLIGAVNDEENQS